VNLVAWMLRVNEIEVHPWLRHPDNERFTLEGNQGAPMLR
jgi:hypothetical protein